MAVTVYRGPMRTTGCLLACLPPAQSRVSQGLCETRAKWVSFPTKVSPWKKALASCWIKKKTFVFLQFNHLVRHRQPKPQSSVPRFALKRLRPFPGPSRSPCYSQLFSSIVCTDAPLLSTLHRSSHEELRAHELLWSLLFAVFFFVVPRASLYNYWHPWDGTHSQKQTHLLFATYCATPSRLSQLLISSSLSPFISTLFYSQSSACKDVYNDAAQRTARCKKLRCCRLAAPKACSAAQTSKL